MHHAFRLGDTEHDVEISRSADGYRLHRDDRWTAIDLHSDVGGRTRLKFGERVVEVVVATRGDEVFIHLDGEVYALRYRHPLGRLAEGAAGNADDRVLAPMPGSIVLVQVQVGDAVSKGQVLLVMESMKMETTITAPRDGVVALVTFAKGQTFDRDAVLLELENDQ